MSDFTKEELRDIYQIFDMQGACRLLGLKAKIKVMIDKHCDHEPSDAHYEQFRWQLCAKCGVQYK